MPDEGQPLESGTNTTKIVILVIAAVYVIVSGWLLFDGRSRISQLESQQKAVEQAQLDLSHKIAAAKSEAEGSSSALAEKIGMTQKDLATRAVELQRQQKASEARLTQQQQQQISAVSGDIAGVKTEVGGVKTDVATTKTELEATKAKLERVMGDMNVMSGLIARNSGDLDVLKKKGERNYYEFTLLKGKKPVPVATVSLQLKKVDVKRGKFTLNVLSDDRTYEKKDRLMNEPLQFYSGRDRLLYELVVWSVEKNKVSGYLATPLNAPKPPTP